MASNNVDSCVKTRDKLLKATRINPSRIDCRQLNGDSTRSVRRFAANLLADYPRLDRVIIQSCSCITGIVAGKRRPTHDGFEHIMGTNYFATYLLARLLWSRLSESEDGRLILVADTDASARAQAQAPQLPDSDQLGLPLQDLNFDDPNTFTPKIAYQRSQWFLTLFADELSRRTAHETMTRVMLVNPVVSLATAPRFSGSGVETLTTEKKVVFDQAINFITRLVKRKVSATTLFCAVVDPVVLPSRAAKNERVVQSAERFQDLRLISDQTTLTQNINRTLSASQYLWKLSEKWTRLDKYPEPLPLPPRLPTPGNPVASHVPPGST
ncbi:Retinol dehydrogenase 13 [Fasciola gigantica]|uniref:Retinol dehydrogenase 13 n=1 Tax=Fasciola gigantica TaxID=46835 RepID=A0A504YDJ0_FASGI|nr:Retinol dehydrogenase 13 [Fasciola gigantica]